MRRPHALLLSVVLGACAPERALAPLEACTTWRTEQYVAAIQTADVADILIVVDTTAGMGPAQRAVGAALPAFFDGLASGDLDHDGLREATPMRSIHVGVVTSDRGCGSGARTELTRGPGADAAGIFAFGSDGPMTAADAAASVAATVVGLGTSGCAVSEPLDAAIDGIELLPRAEDGFARPQGALVVLVVTSHDDCSGLEARSIRAEARPPSASRTPAT